jgi:hypothetical protein
VLPDLTTNQKGALAETKITAAAMELGIDVYRPAADGGRCDLIFDLAGSLVRVQCKWALRRGAVVAVACYSARRTRHGLVRRFYRPSEIDAYAAYCAELERCYFLWMREFAGRSQIQLRLAPPNNNQRAKINWASDYEFAATLSNASGAVAQLGERRAGSAKATGSSPVGSI